MNPKPIPAIRPIINIINPDDRDGVSKVETSCFTICLFQRRSVNSGESSSFDGVEFSR
jgi:hypothetical protein